MAAATMTESPDAAREMACPIVLHAVDGDRQLLPSFPLTPFTYHVVLAKAFEARSKNSAKTGNVLIVSLSFINFFLVRRLTTMQLPTIGARVGLRQGGWPVPC